MAPKKKIVATLIAGAMAVAGWWMTSEFDASAPPSSPPVTAAEAPPAALPPSSQDPKTPTPPSPPPQAVAELAFRRFEANPASATPEVCLYFSGPLRAGQPEAYTPFVRFEPGPLPPLRVEDNRLCLSGLSYNTSYSATLRAGLPGQGEATLAEERTVELSLGDRPAMLSLGKGFWLPRSGESSLPIHTVNVDRLKVTIYRVGERAFARMEDMFLTETAPESYQISNDLRGKGAVVWSDTVVVSAPRNQDAVTQLALPESVTKGAPGAYLVVAQKMRPDGTVEEYDDELAGQWVIRSDLGMTAYHADNGLMVVVRSLASAKPNAQAQLSLIAANSEILATVPSDADGKVVFPAGLMNGKGGTEPIMVVARQGEDLNLLDLRGSAFDLSDRGVKGREPAGAVDAFLYSERGIYRPGETVYLTGLIRDARAVTIANKGTWFLKILRPNGRELGTFPVQNEGNGAFSYTLALPKTASLGIWEALLYSDPKGQQVGRIAFEVDSFVPQRLGVTVTAPAGIVGQGERLEIPVEARFLYGAVGAGLDGEASLSILPDPKPFPQHVGFTWGREDEQRDSPVFSLDIAQTDDAGRTLATGTMPEVLTSTQPLRGNVRVDIAEPGGRATGEEVSFPVASAPLFLGVRPAFKDGVVRQGSEAAFEVMAVNRDGVGQANQSLTYRITKIKTIWQWYNKDGAWSYQAVTREHAVASGSITTQADTGLAKISQLLPWGHYRLDVIQSDTQAQASYQFYSGWYGESSEDRPDRLTVSSDKPTYAPGEAIRLHIDSDRAGEATVVIANESIHQTHLVSVPAGGADLALTMGQDWAAGAYALVSLYHPQNGATGHAPIRSVGVVWLGTERESRTLSVALAAPSVMTPRQVLNVPLKVSGAQGQAFVTVAAVDQGILNLTKFRSPDPVGYYFKQRRLGVGLVDDYGRIIRAQAANGTDEGGDAGHGQGLETVPTRSVALFSGIVAVQPDGSATIPLEVPDFQGELRLMAVAFDQTKVGSAEQPVTVRDPVVADVILPRFLASGDDGRATVLLHNVNGQAGDYHVSLTASHPLQGGDPDKVVSLAAGQRVVYTVPLSTLTQGDSSLGVGLGVGKVRLQVSGPSFAVERDWPLEVRPPQARISSHATGMIQPGQTVSLPPDAARPMIEGSARGSVTLSRWLSVDVAGLLRSLAAYPYACLEQSTSRAMPLLFFKDIADPLWQQKSRSVDQDINHAIERITSLQLEGDDYASGFALWSPDSYDSSPWLTVYAVDFLLQAAEKGYWVPAKAQELGLAAVQSIARRRDSDEHDATAYAMALLARRGMVDRQALNAFHDEGAPKSVVALSLLGSAFDAISDQARAADSYQQALQGWSKMQELRPQVRTARAAVVSAHEKAEAKALEAAKKRLSTLEGEYGSYASWNASSWHPSDITILYRLIAALASSNRLADVPRLLNEGALMKDDIDALSTEEQAAMLLAAGQLARNTGRVVATVNGRTLGKGDPVVEPLTAAELKGDIIVENKGDGTLFYSLSSEGFPRDPLAADSSSITLEKSVFTLNGEPVNLQDIHQNQRLVVIFSGKMNQAIKGEYALLDLLPAGWDVEGVVHADMPGLKWIGPTSSLTSSTASDDRVIAVTSLPGSLPTPNDPKTPTQGEDQQWSMRVAYVVRAVTPGRFALPAVVAEHMRFASVRGRSEMGTVVIAE